MVSINLQLFNKSMAEAIEHMEKLEVLEATNKQASTKNLDETDDIFFQSVGDMVDHSLISSWHLARLGFITGTLV